MKYVIYMVALVLITNCSGTKQFTEQENQAFASLKSLVASKKFKIESYKASALASAAFTQVVNSGLLGPGNNASWIDITSNSNYLTIKGDTISAFLPFYGEQHLGGSYPGSNHEGIEFNNAAEDYKVTENDAKHTVMVQFTIDDRYRNIEHYNVFITLFPNNHSDIQVLSSSRSSMEFTGNVEVLKEEGKKK
ncbi:MAG: DUF4251 domain-containing protein [Aquaticitalea sp.]